MIFQNREEAARLLVEKLQKYKGQNPLVLGIPRGAMSMAKIIAEGLGGELGAILVRKIPAPFNEELAIGSIGLSGVVLMPHASEFGIDKEYIDRTAKKQLELIKKRQRDYGLPAPDYAGRLVIIVDDGIATGATTMAAVREARALKPERLVLAAGVATPHALKDLEALADEVVVLHAPPDLYAISPYFIEFPQISDEEVIEILNEARASAPRAAAS